MRFKKEKTVFALETGLFIYLCIHKIEFKPQLLLHYTQTNTVQTLIII